MKRNVWVLGGAGFVGSAVACAYAQCGDDVTVVDGFLPQTGADCANLRGFGCKLIDQRIEKLDAQTLETLAYADVIIDAMAWTSHVAALKSPEYDLELNVKSHMHLLMNLPEGCGAHIVYLGSRGQYGRMCDTPICEGSRMMPDDIQGIHKTAADHYGRVLARVRKLKVTCLRFPNCYGPGQKVSGADIGLIGGFIRDALAGRTIEIFNRRRFRNIVYVKDVAECVLRLGNLAPAEAGYDDYNMAGIRVNLVDLARLIVEGAQSGTYAVTEMPEEIRAIDIGDVPVCEDKLQHRIPLAYSDTARSLEETISYFRRVMV